MPSEEGEGHVKLRLAAIPRRHLQRLHQASLTILAQTGVEVHSAELRHMLARAGAQVEGARRVRISAELVERARSSAPSRVVIHDRGGRPAMVLQGKRCYFGTGSDLRFTLDHLTGQRRESTLADVAAAARLCDELPNIDFVMSYALPSDVPDSQSEVEQFRAMLGNTRKPIIQCLFSGTEAAAQVHALACAACGGEDAFREAPSYIVYGQFISPFEHDSVATSRLMFCADHGVPIIYTPTIMIGASGPVTMAGAIATANAECLAGLVMHQLRAPGAPFIYGGCVSPLDMRTTVYSYGAPERRLADAVLSQLSLRYRLPVFGTAGATDALRIDAQAGAEWAYSLLLSALAGTNLIHDVGYMESGLAGSLEALVICDEIIGMVKRLVAGFAINRETLALEVINQVGPGGHFMGEEHTVRHFRTAIWYPSVFARDRFERWQAAGGADLLDRARAVAVRRRNSDERR